MAGRGFGLFFLHQFQPIAEGVPQFEAVKAWDGDGVQDSFEYRWRLRSIRTALSAS
jgi:hypothetical protein